MATTLPGRRGFAKAERKVHPANARSSILVLAPNRLCELSAHAERLHRSSIDARSSCARLRVESAARSVTFRRTGVSECFAFEREERRGLAHTGVGVGGVDRERCGELSRVPTERGGDRDDGGVRCVGGAGSARRSLDVRRRPIRKRRLLPRWGRPLRAAISRGASRAVSVAPVRGRPDGLQRAGSGRGFEREGRARSRDTARSPLHRLGWWGILHVRALRRPRRERPDRHRAA